jgi:hypothetical protein
LYLGMVQVFLTEQQSRPNKLRVTIDFKSFEAIITASQNRMSYARCLRSDWHLLILITESRGGATSMATCFGIGPKSVTREGSILDGGLGCLLDQSASKMTSPLFNIEISDKAADKIL